MSTAPVTRNSARAGNSPSAALVCAVGLLSLFWSPRSAESDPPRPDFPAVANTPLAADPNLPQILSQPVDLRLQGVPLESALLEITNKYGLSITIDPEVDSGDVNWRQTVTQSSRHVRLATALNDLLNSCGLVCGVRNGCLVITTRYCAQSKLEWREYSTIDLLRAGFSTRQLVTAINGMVFSDSDDTDEDDHVRIVPFEKSLLVRQSVSKHEQIAELLAGLRSRGRLTARTGDQEIEQVLERRVSADFEAIPFEEFIDRLQASLQIPITLNQGEFKQADSGPEHVTIHATDISVGSLLDHVCDALPIRLRAVVRNGELLITSVNLAEAIPNVRIYDLRGLTHQRWIDPAQWGYLIRRFAGSGEDWEGTDSQASKSKSEVIAGLLLVNQPLPVQRDVEALLRRIRRSQAGDASSVLLTASEQCERSLRARLAAPGALPSQSIRVKELPRWLGTHLGVQVWLNPRTKADVESRIELRFDRRSLEEVVQRALDPLDLAIFIEHEMVVVTEQEIAIEHRDVRIYPAWKLSGRATRDSILNRKAFVAIARIAGDAPAEPEEQREFANAFADGGLLFVRARPRLQRAAAEGLGWSDYQSAQKAEWPIEPTAGDNGGTGRPRALPAKSRINP